MRNNSILSFLRLSSPISPGITCLTALAALAIPAGLPAQIIINLGGASGFAVLAGTAVTVPTLSRVTGDMGTSSGTVIAGLEKLTLIGTDRGNNAITQGAQLDLTAAYNDAAGRAPDLTYGSAADLGALTLASGVYKNPSSFAITGMLTLDAGGDPDAYWIFQAGSSLTIAANSGVVLAGGAKAENIFWQVGSSATLGENTDFAGSILALTSITLNTGSMVDGRVLARNGAVTLNGGSVAVPEPSNAVLGLLAFCGALTIRRKAWKPEHTSGV